MRARRKRIPCSILPLIEIAVDLQAAIVTAVTRIPLFPKPSSPFGENKQKTLVDLIPGGLSLRTFKILRNTAFSTVRLARRWKLVLRPGAEVKGLPQRPQRT